MLRQLQLPRYPLRSCYLPLDNTSAIQTKPSKNPIILWLMEYNRFFGWDA